VPPEALEHTPLTSPEVELKVAAAQMACSRSLQANVTRATELIYEAAAENADVVVFPELAAAMAVVIGTPWIENGSRFNCAIAIGPGGKILTRYAQLAVDRPDLFIPGASTRAMWLEIKGVPTVITVGRDGLWSELAELAAARGAQAHLHLAYDRDVSPGASRRRKQRWTNLANYRTLTVLVNAADPSHLPFPSATAQGGSAIWEDYRRDPHITARRSGHGPWSAYRLAEAAEAEELLCARQTVLPVNAHWEMMTRTVYPQMRPWYAVGVQAICSDLSTPAPASKSAPELVGAHA
jgi:predicted amidohydrolase